MPARSPRRSFAAPFVVTLAASPACYLAPSAEPGPPQVSPAPPSAPGSASAPVKTDRPPVGPAVDDVASSRPGDGATTPPADAPAGPARWHVATSKSGCIAWEQQTCPPGVMCNPPPPFAYACPSNVTIGEAGITLVQQPGGTCVVEPPPIACPPGVTCNPPRPQPVACPKRPTR